MRAVLLVAVGVMACVVYADIVVDAAFPGGNVVVEKIDEKAGEVHIKPDDRDSKGWFYTYFRVRGAQGRTIHFHYEPGRERISKIGPAVSSDGGQTWRFTHAEKRDAKPDAFDYAFGANEREVRFSIGIPYVECDWRRFMGTIGENPRVREMPLCVADSGVRTNELLRIASADDAKAKYVFVFTCRHHACEMSASRVMEGVVQAVLGDTAEARWVRKNAACLFVPFVDKDGVETGDPGKRRKPHDHNQDYTAGRYASVRAIRELVRKESQGRQFVFLDLHAPWIREKEHDHFYFLMSEVAAQKPMCERFSAALVETQRGGALVYEPKYDIPGGAPWNNSDDYDKAGLMMASTWASREPNCVLGFTAEIGYGLCGGVYTEPAARELGRNILRAMVRTLTKSENTPLRRGAAF